MADMFIDPNESELNKLFKEILDGIRDDILEAQGNVDMYLEIVEKDQDGKSLFGTLYNDSLKIKGAARARQLQFINTFKERVAKKEQAQQAEKQSGQGNNNFDHAAVNQMMKDLSEGNKLNSINLDDEEDYNEEEPE